MVDRRTQKGVLAERLAAQNDGSMNNGSEAPENLTFGHFRVSPYRRELLADGRPVKLGGRAFDLLMLLIEARGTVVDVRTLMARIWPDRVVTENNLQVQILALRNALGAERDLIRSVPGRGYQFAGEVRGLPADDEPAESRTGGVGRPPPGPPTNLPTPASELVGRQGELEQMLELADR
jgi:DNA-binding winged helix-turn-helix (wHTH) protein